MFECVGSLPFDKVGIALQSHSFIVNIGKVRPNVYHCFILSLFQSFDILRHIESQQYFDEAKGYLYVS